MCLLCAYTTRMVSGWPMSRGPAASGLAASEEPTSALQLDTKEIPTRFSARATPLVEKLKNQKSLSGAVPLAQDQLGLRPEELTCTTPYIALATGS